ncbi:DEAD/DEAH box helicase [Brevibacillus brevis]|uniref:DEAD/DEAH box helicase n=1 Tax=Brevibacillus brevis TaxID=1393 RepID=UPI0011588CB8|nr:DEAD/DEAH box helicase family protein [Lysinibacillus sp. SDF0063]TQR30201.1 restriction endonuclease [Lysinibacillus sp. SDF0063]
MEPNSYQKKVLGRLRDFLRLLDAHSPADAYRALWESRDVNINPIGGNGMPPYRDTIQGVPHVCFKVPTGGGKTFLATCAVRYIKEELVQSGEGAVVWLVPSDTILEQTLANLNNIDHPYRQQLQKDFPAGVEVYSKEQLINGQNFQNLISVQEHLSVFVLSYDSFRTSKKDGRRAYRENAKLKDFPVSDTLPDGADETSLVNAINVLNPIIIVDESHHAAGQLSIEMLRNFNPRFILDLTATPRENSNIIAFAEASELKKANMVKLPLIVYNRADKKDVMFDAIQLRAQIERQAVCEEDSGGKYIRPIVLFQAQPRGKEDAATFQKLKDQLVEGGIPVEQIAIKTANVNELRNVNLLSRDCEIRYIITVNALKEGWDCPFAYILATLANKTSKVDVEQIVGRILRQPHAEKHNQPLLNNAFVLTCSNEFAATLDSIVRALNTAGFSKKDVRIAEERPQVEPQAPVTTPVNPALLDESDNDDSADFLGDYSGVISSALEQKPSASVEDMLDQAVTQTQVYEREAEESEKLGYHGGLEGAMRNQYKINSSFNVEAEELRVPQFCFVTEPDLFHTENFAKLSKEKLSVGFSLNNADSNVNFSLAGGVMYAIDASDSGARYRKMTSGESEYIRSQMERLPDEGKRKFCIDLIAGQLERKKIGDVILRDELRAYVERVVANLTNNDFAAILTSYQFYASRIQQKIETLLANHREGRFFNLLEARDILCRPMFALPKVITPVETLGGLEKSLYESEAAVNSTERKVIEEIAALPNVKWWHRIAESKPYSFNINGFITHYPDFFVMTSKGVLVVVEVKGDDRDNSDSERKLRLGRKWADKAGDGYRYYMVFDKLNWSKEGAYDLSEFVELMKRL